jgi:hypothetical protein
MDAVAQKICTGCGMDVASVKRFKDLEGNYYCEPCWNVHTAKLEEDKRAKRAAAKARQASHAESSTTTAETDADPEAHEHEDIPTDPLLAALAGAAATQRPEIEKNPDGTDKPIPAPRRHKGPGKWVLWVMILVGITLLFACAMVVVMIFKGPDKPPAKPTSNLPVTVLNYTS